MSTIKSYLSLVRFSHTIFAMPFALIGFFLGWSSTYSNSDPVLDRFGLPDHWRGALTDVNFEAVGEKLLLVVLCMVFARSTAMAFNRYLDRDFDAKNPRTAIREIPAGIISAKST
ncbi:MAG TPA: UbiA family prenyltransferase, partial [Chitinophagaceae bacterium]